MADVAAGTGPQGQAPPPDFWAQAAFGAQGVPERRVQREAEEPAARASPLLPAARCPVSDVRSSGRPNFDHLDFHDKGSKWSDYMSPRAEQLVDTLWRVGAWEQRGQCLVCETELPNNMASHLWGAKHLKALRNRLNWEYPKSPAHLEEFTQYWPVRNGGPQPCYRFNHVTGEHGFCPPPGNPPQQPQPPQQQPQQQPPQSQPVPQQPQQAPQQPMQQLAAPAPQLPVGAATPAAQSMPAAAQPAPAAPSMQPSGPSGPCDYMGAFQAAGAWRTFMEPRAKHLEEMLTKLAGSVAWESTCSVCDKQMTRGCQDHMCSKGHWQNLWKKLGNGTAIPRQWEQANDWSAQWIQAFLAGSDKAYLFNHITGEQMIRAGAAAPAGAAPPAYVAPAAPAAPMGAPAPAQAASAAPAPGAPPVGPSPPQGPGAPPMGPPVAASPTLPAPAAPTPALPTPAQAFAMAGAPSGPSTALAGQPYPTGQLEPPVRGGINFFQAMNAKGDWKSYMEASADALENFMYTACPAYLEKNCIVCEAPRNGIKNHITSQNHFKKLWSKIPGKLPSPEDVVDRAKPWVEKIPTARGMYLFNHFTGEQGFQDGAAPASGPAPAPGLAAPAPGQAAPAAAPTGLAAPPAVASPAPAVVPQQPVAPAAPQALVGASVASAATPIAAGPAVGGAQPAIGGPCKLDEWIWVQAIGRHPDELAQALAERGFGNAGKPVICGVCQQPIDNVAGHIRSPDHYRNLRHRMQFDAPQKERLSIGPWVQQAFSTPQGEQVAISFNHLTGEVKMPPQPQDVAG